MADSLVLTNTLVTVAMMSILSALLILGLRKLSPAYFFRALALILLVTNVSYAIVMVLIGIETNYQK